MFTFLIETLTAVQRGLERLGRGAQLLVGSVCGLLCIVNAQALYLDIVSPGAMLNVLNLLISGIITICTGYIACVSLVYFLSDRTRTLDEQQADRLRAVYHIPREDVDEDSNDHKK